MIKIEVNSERLEVEIAKKNLSQNDFAQLIGMSNGYISQIANHTRYPSPKTRQMMQDALGLEFDDLFIIKQGEKPKRVTAKAIRVKTYHSDNEDKK